MIPLGVIQQQAFGGGSTLLDGLVSWWSMDETSGTRVDSHGSNNLTVASADSYGTGKVGNSWSQDGSTVNYLVKTSPTNLDSSDSLFVAVCRQRVQTEAWRLNPGLCGRQIQRKFPARAFPGP